MGNTEGRATVKRVYDFDPEPAAEKLKDAMTGFGTSEEPIVEILGNHAFEERRSIQDYFKSAYGEDLVEVLKSELGGNFEDLAVAMFTPPRLFDAKEINRAISGAGTDESMLIEIMATRSNSEMDQIKEAYKKEFESEMEDDLSGDTSGYFRRLMISLCNGGRDESSDVDYDLANEDAIKIKEAGADQWGTDEADFNSVLCTRNIYQLKATFKAYQEQAGQDIKEAINSECDGSLQDGYIAVVRAAESIPDYFAWRINHSIAGAGTEDRDLIRQIVSRSEVDLGEIKDSYQVQFEKNLEEAVAEDCGGDYKSLLLAILKEQ